MLYSGHQAEFHAEHLDLYQMDCMELLRQTPDKHYSLCVCDPPYGIETRGHAQDRFRRGQSLALVNDAKPTREYFAQLMRVSHNQIVWGYNHLSDILPSCREFIFWYKHNPVVTFADGELAWTSFQKTARCCNLPCFGSHGQDIGKFHPTQKPVALYRWLLSNYAKPGDNIFDSHMGSGSIAIACHYAGYHLTATELDQEYFDAAVERIKRETAQQTLAI